ncbi:MAG: hypothetical protein ABI776_11745 [Nocardioidaceae bacterium]
MSKQAAMSTLPHQETDREGPQDLVPRFGRTERFAHWWTVSMVAAALLTGLGLGDESSSGPLLVAHVSAVVLIGVGLLTALVLGDTRSLLRATYRLFVFDCRDLA